jgi:hypothetical protein
MPHTLSSHRGECKISGYYLLCMGAPCVQKSGSTTVRQAPRAMALSGIIIRFSVPEW